MMFLRKIGKWSKQTKGDLITLYYAIQDQGTPLYLKIASFIVVSYALSPIDFIPDFIPIIGLLDDLVIVTFGIYIIVKLLPRIVLDRSREKSLKLNSRPVSLIGAGIVFMLWVGLTFLLFLLLKKSY